MSAWAQAAWIISQLDYRFDFTQSLNEYEQIINDTASRMQGNYEDIFNKTRVIIQPSQPDPSSFNLITGTLWFGLKRE